MQITGNNAWIGNGAAPKAAPNERFEKATIEPKPPPGPEPGGNVKTTKVKEAPSQEPIAREEKQDLSPEPKATTIATVSVIAMPALAGAFQVPLILNTPPTPPVAAAVLPATKEPAPAVDAFLKAGVTASAPVEVPIGKELLEKQKVAVAQIAVPKKTETVETGKPVKAGKQIVPILGGEKKADPASDVEGLAVKADPASDAEGLAITTTDVKTLKGGTKKVDPDRDVEGLDFKTDPTHDEDIVGFKVDPDRDVEVFEVKADPTHDEDGLGFRADPDRDVEGVSFKADPSHDEDTVGFKVDPDRDVEGLNFKADPSHDEQVLDFKIDPERDVEGLDDSVPVDDPAFDVFVSETDSVDKVVADKASDEFVPDPATDATIKGRPETSQPLQLNSQKTVSEPKGVKEIRGERLEKVVNQITDRIEMLAGARPKNGVTILLEPRELGSITMNVRSSGNQVEATIQASNADVRTALQQNRNLLDASMQARGLSLGSMSVSDHGAPQHQSNASQSPRQAAVSERTLDMPDTATTRVLRRSGRDVDLWI